MLESGSDAVLSFTLDGVIDDLGYRRAEDLLEQDHPEQTVAPSRRQAWEEATERLGINAAFFQGGVPLVYFRGLRLPPSEDVETAIADLHRQAWNHGRAPFLVVVLPNEVRVLDSLSAPFDDFTLLSASAPARLQEALSEFSYGALMSGQLTGRLEGRRRRTVVDQLRSDLSAARSQLLAQGLDSAVAKDLLARSLFLQYLSDRGVLGRVADQADTEAFDLVSEQPVENLYTLFAKVYARFNGDVFPVTEAETAAVTEEHISLVFDFLQGTRSGQLRLLNYYDFSVIPAELLSNIYEEFLEGEQRSSAAHYTPEHIVDLALEEVLPVGGPAVDPITILDPACGSGIFLARAYRRLIDLRERQVGRRLKPVELSQLLAESVFGCDTMETAVRVAAFSCYLVLLDHCDADDLAEKVRFPTLVGRNLFVGDFFELQQELAGPYEVIASNPPWKRWTPPAERYVAEHLHPAGDKQLAHAFLWGCAGQLSATGQMVMLMPAKMLYNTSNPNSAFRRAVVERAGLDLVIDFSAFRRQLFANASGPMALLVMNGRERPVAPFITFCTPHPTPLSSSTGRVVLAGGDIKRLARKEAARRPEYFKATLAGSLRDANLLERIRRRFPSFADLEQNGDFLLGAGYQIKGGDAHLSPFLNRTPRIVSDDVEPFKVSRFSPCPTAPYFHRTRDKDLFIGAHLVLARAIDRHGFVQVAYVDRDASFNDSLLGIAAPGQAPHRLQVLAALLNSSIVRYLLFLTATSWGVERPRLEAQDFRGLPLAFPPDGSEDFSRLAQAAVRGAASGATKELRQEIDTIATRLYGLEEHDRFQIQDLLEFSIDLHYRQARSIAFASPTPEVMSAYRTVLADALSGALDVGVETRMSDGEGPWATVAVGLGEPASTGSTQYISLAAASQAAQESSGTVVLRRTMRVYQPHGILMTKPAEARHWSRSAALQDADDIVAECLSAAVRDEALVLAGEASENE